MTEDRHEDAVRVGRIDRDARDLLAIAQPEMLPRAPRIVRAIEAVAGGQIGALQSFAAAHVDDVGVRRRYLDRPD